MYFISLKKTADGMLIYDKNTYPAVAPRFNIFRQGYHHYQIMIMLKLYRYIKNNSLGIYPCWYP